MLEWAQEHRELFMWISIASAVFFVGSLIAVGIVIVRLPADYLKRNDKKDGKHASDSNSTQAAGGPAATTDARRSAGATEEASGNDAKGDSHGKRSHLALRIAKNILGWTLIAAGLAMLVLPGQGLLVLLIGVMLADFPGKRRVQRWILSRPKVMKSINWIRKKFDKPPMEKPERVTEHKDRDCRSNDRAGCVRMEGRAGTRGPTGGRGIRIDAVGAAVWATGVWTGSF